MSCTVKETGVVTGDWVPCLVFADGSAMEIGELPFLSGDEWFRVYDGKAGKEGAYEDADRAAVLRTLAKPRLTADPPLGGEDF